MSFDAYTLWGGVHACRNTAISLCINHADCTPQIDHCVEIQFRFTLQRPEASLRLGIYWLNPGCDHLSSVVAIDRRGVRGTAVDRANAPVKHCIDTYITPRYFRVL